MNKFGLQLEMKSLPQISSSASVGMKSVSNFDTYGENRQRQNVKLPPLRKGSPEKQSISSVPSKTQLNSQPEGVTYDDIEKDRNADS